MRRFFQESIGTGPTRLQIGLWFVILGLTLWLLVSDWNSYRVGTYGDEGSYIAATDSLVKRIPYGTLLDPNRQEPTQFPFLFPLLLAPWRVWFPNTLDALRIVSLVATLGVVTVLFWGWRWLGRGLSWWWGLAVTALMALSPVTILHGRAVMAEALFMLFTLLLILWVERVVERPPRAWGILFGLGAVAMVYTRTIGWIFLVVLLLYLVWKLRARVIQPMGVALMTAVVALGIVLAATTVQAQDLLPQEYLMQYSDLVNGVGRPAETAATNRTTNPGNPTNSNARAPLPFKYLDVLWISVLNHLDIADKLPYQLERAVIDTTERFHVSFLRYVPILIALGVCVAGAWSWVRRTGVTAFQLVAPPYLGALLLWAWNGSRLMYPIQPHLFLALLLGVMVVAARGSKTFARLAVIGITVFILLGAVWLGLRLNATMLLPEDPSARAGLLQQYIPPGAVVLSSRAENDYLYMPNPFLEVPRDIRTSNDVVTMLVRHKIEYVVAVAGLNPTPENDNLRVGRVRRFVILLQPLIQKTVVSELYFDTKGDVAIYRVDLAAAEKYAR